MTAFEAVELQGSEYPVTLRRNVRAKRMTLRVCPKDKLIKVTLPPRMSLRKAESFILSHEKWILEKLQAFVPQDLPEQIDVLGEAYPIRIDPLRVKGHVCEETQTINLPAKKTRESLKECLVELAFEKLSGLCEGFAKSLKVDFKKVTLRDPKSRWGSCSSTGKVMLSWRLILASKDVAAYVCAHEICHLVHMNHSVAFWDLVGRLCPGYQTHRKWLRKNGNTLFFI